MFLTGRGVDGEALRRATALARRHGSTPAEELLAAGLDAQHYWSALAEDLRLPFLDDLSDAVLLPHPSLLATEAVRLAASAYVRIEGRSLILLAPGPAETARLRERLRTMPGLSERIAIAEPRTIRAFIVANRHRALTHYAVNRLAHRLPPLSARDVPSANGVGGPTALLAAALALGQLAPFAALQALLLLAMLFFVNCSVWKLAAAFTRLKPLRVEPGFGASGRLPVYTVLVPLYREAAVVPDLVAHLEKLDYPASRLQVLLVLEADDRESRAAVARHATAPRFEMVVVPPGGPRTKPKALSYALAFARGDLVVVFDAEDRPEADQLLKAAAAFRAYPQLGCLQARLQPDNEESWPARMFTLEYAANFELLLPALAAWRVPLPLGGTSNHFPRKVLEAVCGWDPYNVTEDADLGIRLARFGYSVATLDARTYEEAPIGFRQWLPQRRRWVKGWMQTVLLSLGFDIPKSLALPLRQQLAVHGILTAGVLGLLLYPLSLAVIAAAIHAALVGAWPTTVLGWAMLTVSFGNLAAVLVAAAVSALRGLRAAGSLRLASHVPLLPLYWGLMSLAAWQALFQLVRRPSEWEKTAHGVSRRRRRVRRRAP